MKENFDKALEYVLHHEGGWANHKNDPGGATMQGITLRTYRSFYGKDKTARDLRNISDTERDALYRKMYWDEIAGDALPPGLDYLVFNAAVHSGPKRASKWLQQALGNVEADGIIGPKTLNAVAAADTEVLINEYWDLQMTFLRNLSHWKTFGRGWTNRMMDVRESSMELVA